MLSQTTISVFSHIFFLRRDNYFAALRDPLDLPPAWWKNIREVFERESAVCRYNPFSLVSERRRRRGVGVLAKKAGGVTSEQTEKAASANIVRKQYCERAIQQ